jgi:hypothetical protein
MAWVIKISQTRPGPTVSAGTPGIARRDLWRGQLVTLEAVWDDGPSPGGTFNFHWEILDQPAHSVAELSSAGGTGVTSVTFTPDVATYSFRVELRVDTGGAGKVDTRVVCARYDESGTLLNRGWRFPSLSEETGNANFADDVLSGEREWLSSYEQIFADILLMVGVEIGALAGDVTGLIGATTVEKIQGRSILNTSPDAGNVLLWDGSDWGPAELPASVTFAGDLSGSSSSQTVLKVNGTSVPASPTAAQVLVASNGTTATWTLLSNPNIASDAAIAGTKVDPNFGSQTVTALAAKFGASLWASDGFIRLPSWVSGDGILLGVRNDNNDGDFAALSSIGESLYVGSTINSTKQFTDVGVFAASYVTLGLGSDTYMNISTSDMYYGNSNVVIHQFTLFGPGNSHYLKMFPGQSGANPGFSVINSDTIGGIALFSGTARQGLVFSTGQNFIIASESIANINGNVPGTAATVRFTINATTGKVSIGSLTASRYVTTDGSNDLASQNGIPKADVQNDSGVTGDLLYWNGTNWISRAAVALGFVLKSAGVGVAPAYGPANVKYTQSITSNTFITTEVQTVFANATGGSFTATVLAGYVGQEHVIIHTGSANTVTVATGGINIVGPDYSATTYVLYAGESLRITYNGTVWYII